MLTETPNFCPTPDEFIEVFNALGELRECTSENLSEFRCKRFEAEAEGAANGRACVIVEAEDTNVNPASVGVDRKMLVVVMKVTTNFQNNQPGGTGEGDSNVNGQTPDATYAITVNCAGTPVATQEFKGTNVANLCYDCPVGSEVEICITNNATIRGGTVGGRFTVTLCGASVCIGEVENPVQDTVFIPDVEPNCCFGRDAIHLIIQNLNAFRDAYTDNGQIPSCTTFTFEDRDDHTLLAAAATTTDFLLVGSARVCSGNSVSFNRDAVITIDPQVRCGGSGNLSCPGDSVIIPASDGNQVERCLDVPIIACGRCEAGSAIQVGIRSRVLCDEDPVIIVNNFEGPDFVEQHYCLYTFERNVFDSGDALNGALGECITTNDTAAINAMLLALTNACNDQATINLTDNTASGSTVALNGAQTGALIQEDIVWDPADGSPVKKWFIMGWVEVCDDYRDINGDSNTAIVATTLDIECGGASVLAQGPIVHTWDYTPNGNSIRCHVVPIMRCVECDARLPMTAVFSSRFVSGDFPNANEPHNYTYNFKAFCF
jgi:hypothetical protein